MFKILDFKKIFPSILYLKNQLHSFDISGDFRGKKINEKAKTEDVCKVMTIPQMDFGLNELDMYDLGNSSTSIWVFVTI